MNRLKTFSIVLLLTWMTLFSTASAQTTQQPVAPKTTDYQLLTPVPFVSTRPDGSTCVKDGVPCATTSSFIPGLFRLGIALATGLAVVMLIYGGIQYMSTDAWGEKNEAKGTISNAIIGLLLTMSAWLIIYTINPNLVNFNLSIPTYEVPRGSLDTGILNTQVACLGNCPYSYSVGITTINYRDCVSCSAADSFGLNIKNNTVGGRQAQMNTDLGNRLRAVQSTAGNPAFRVTETWPPTVNHANQGQYDGTSVDVGLTNPTAPNIITFIANANAQGLSAVYEVRSEADRTAYINAGVPAANIITVPRITADHFSIKKR